MKPEETPAAAEADVEPSEPENTSEEPAAPEAEAEPAEAEQEEADPSVPGSEAEETDGNGVEPPTAASISDSSPPEAAPEA